MTPGTTNRADLRCARGTLLLEGEQTDTRDVGVKNHCPALHAHQKISETNRAPMQPTGRGYRLAAFLVRAVTKPHPHHCRVLERMFPGRTVEASAAAEHAITIYDFNETTEPALVRFEQASAFAQAGEIQGACRVATNAVLDRRTYRGVTVIARAKEFDLLLGPSNCGAIRDWRELLASLRPPQLALAATPEESNTGESTTEEPA